MERRKSARMQLSPPDICILHTGAGTVEDGKNTPGGRKECYFVDLLNKSSNGGLLRSVFAISEGRQFLLSTFNGSRKEWRRFNGCVAWVRQAQGGRNAQYLIGAKLRQCPDIKLCQNGSLVGDKRIPLEDDYEFFLRTELMNSLPRDAVVPLINSVFHKHVKAGERFIAQGGPGDACYLIQRGTCVARLEKNGRAKTVARLRQGSVVGEMALLTGEPRSAHVFAETDVSLWGLTRSRFDDLESSHPELRTFLTNVLTLWLDSREEIADRHIGKYIISDVIGQGAYSIVYGGRHRDLDMPVAIKMMRHDMAMEPDFIASFRKEARTIAHFNHQQIVKIFDIEERYRTVFIVMEYLPGRPLRRILDTMPRLTPAKIIKYIRQICQGLRYAHQQAIVHLDIKPANIFICPDDNVKIVDFGLCCPCGTETMMSGTPFYMSPEQVECMPVDTRTDIYSLGVMTYEMATGQKPFSGNDPWAVMNQHATRNIPDPAEVAAGIPEGLRNMILKACAKDPADRYQRVDEILSDLYPGLEDFSFASPLDSAKQNQMTALWIQHQDWHQPELYRLVAEFRKKLEDTGMHIRHMDVPRYPDIKGGQGEVE